MNGGPHPILWWYPATATHATVVPSHYGLCSGGPQPLQPLPLWSSAPPPVVPSHCMNLHGFSVPCEVEEFLAVNGQVNATERFSGNAEILPESADINLTFSDGSMAPAGRGGNSSEEMDVDGGVHFENMREENQSRTNHENFQEVPVQCQDNPYGFNAEMVIGERSYPLNTGTVPDMTGYIRYISRNENQSRTDHENFQEVPVQCQDNPYGFNAEMVIGERSYRLNTGTVPDMTGYIRYISSIP